MERHGSNREGFIVMLAPECLRTERQEWLLSNWRRCVQVYGWQQRQCMSLEGNYRSPQIWHAEPIRGPEPDRIEGYRVEDAWRRIDSVADRMLLRYLHVFRVSEAAARRMLRRSWGCDVAEVGPALLMAEIRLWEGYGK